MEPLKIFYYVLLFGSLAALKFNQTKLYVNNIRLIEFLFVCSIVTEISVDLLKYYYNITYWVVFHVYQPVEYILLTYLFYFNTKSKNLKKCTALSVPLYLATLFVYYSMSRESLFVPKYFDFVLESFLVSIWAALYMLELVSSDELSESIITIPLFWIAFATIIFYSGSIFIMGFRYYLDMSAPALSQIARSVGHYLNFLFYLLLIFAFIWIPFMKKPSLV